MADQDVEELLENHNLTTEEEEVADLSDEEGDGQEGARGILGDWKSAILKYSPHLDDHDSDETGLG